MERHVVPGFAGVTGKSQSTLTTRFSEHLNEPLALTVFGAAVWRAPFWQGTCAEGVMKRLHQT